MQILDEAPDALTAREWEVAHLVAEGLTNREIGARLVITERTAETHVRHALMKRGLSNRVRLALYALTQGQG